MISIFNVKKSKIGEVASFLLQLRGLSGDDKPTSWSNGTITNGSEFIEIDTGDVYLFDGENTEWYNVTTPEIQEENEETQEENDG